MMTERCKLTRIKTEGIPSLHNRLVRMTLVGCDKAAGRLNLGPAPNIGPLTSGTMRAFATLKSSQAQSLDDSPEAQVILAAMIILEMHSVVCITLDKSANRYLLNRAFQIASEASPGIQMPPWLAKMLEVPDVERPESLDFKA